MVKVIRHKAALPVLYITGPFFAFKIALPHVSIWTPSDTWLLGSHPGPLPQWRLALSGNFCRAYNHVRDADRSRYSWCNNRPDLANAAVRPNNIERICRAQNQKYSDALAQAEKIAKPLNVAQSAPLLGGLVDSGGSKKVRISWACT